MQRRTAIQKISLAIGGTVLLPAWAKAWDKESLQCGSIIISNSQEKQLAEIVEAIIPETDTPGAKDLNIHLFVTKMITDCYDKKSQKTFTNGFTSVDSTAQRQFSKPFIECDKKQKLVVLYTMVNSANLDEKNFIHLVKSLTIQGYLKSEYVMTNLLIYEFVPARYHGCVKVSK
jgi:Gluconate 2-dehydrogenase subunit 3